MQPRTFGPNRSGSFKICNSSRRLFESSHVRKCLLLSLLRQPNTGQAFKFRRPADAHKMRLPIRIMRTSEALEILVKLSRLHVNSA